MSRATFFDLDCPTCGRPLQIRLNLLGKLVNCRHCRAKFTATADQSGGIRGELATPRDIASEKATVPIRDELDRVERLLAQADQFLADDALPVSGDVG